MIRRPPISTQRRSSAASDVYKRQVLSAEAVSATEVKLSYATNNVTNATIFRDSDKVVTVGSGNVSGVYNDKDLAPDTVFVYTLRNGDTIGATKLAEATVGTPKPVSYTHLTLPTIFSV